MPGKVKVKVLAGRNLPVMDRAGDTTDAFVEIKFGGVTHKTDVCRKSLNPQWNSTEWYRFEVDESELQDEPLQLRLMDHDTYSANDAIGKVVISLAPLLAREAAKSDKTAGPHNGAVMSGWIPVFDTMHGIRGELNVIVKVELFSDFNKYKTSSVGVQFFHCPMIPPGYKASAIHGFVEELVVNDDPEYQWIDKIRTPRASNEARQVAFIKLSNQVQRLVGLKAAELGANAVVGYLQDFDLEGEAGVVARAIGTAVSIDLLPTPSQPQTVPPCSQQQLKKYLDILATGDETVTDLNQYFQNHQDELGKLLTILHPKLSSNFLDETENNEDDEKSMNLTRQSSIKSYTDSVSIYQDEFVTQSLRTIAEDQTELNKLLNRYDEEDSDSPGPISKIKKIKQNFFVKRLSSIRSKKGKKDKNEDTMSIKSNSSDTSRLSVNDIRNEFKKLKRLKTPKFKKQFKNDDDEGVGMASILARSVIHAHTSLACIAETQDSEASPNSTMRRTSESEPKINVTDEENVKPDIKINEDQVSDIRYASLANVNTVTEAVPQRQRKISGSCPNSPKATRSHDLLKLPGETGYFGSISSALSGESSEMYSSSDADDESSNMNTDNEKTYETAASIVQTVLRQAANTDLIVHNDKKLNVAEGGTSEIKVSNSEGEEAKAPEVENDKNEQLEGFKRQEPSWSEQSVTKPSLNFKFHNPFTHKSSVSAPSSPVEKTSIVYRSSKKIKRQLSKISNSSMIKSISHISLLPKKKEKPMSQPASSSDIASKGHSHETVLGSAFISYTDLLSLDRELDDKIATKDTPVDRPKVEMYIGSEPASRASVSGPSSPYSLKEDPIEHRHRKEKPAVKQTGLIHTAMETILMDKVQSLLIPTTPEVSLEHKFFADVNQKLEKVEESRKPPLTRQDSVSIETPRKMSNDSVTIPEPSRQTPRKMSSDSVTIPEPSRKTPRKMSNDSIPEPSRQTRRKVSNDSVIIPEPSPQTRNMSDDPIAIPKPSSHAPMLQHFHPIMSAKLETIPSLPESSVDKLDSGSETNGSVVNKHAEWSKRFGRSEKSSPRHSRHESYSGREPAPAQPGNVSLNASSTPVGMHRRSSDSDLSITPKGSLLNASAGNPGGAILRPSMNTNNLDMLEYPFLTMTEFPPGFIVHIGGMVCARSVKLVCAGGEAAAARAAGWAELRTELRAHARALRCTVVLGYRETAAICDEVCVLSASGTAALVDLDCDLAAAGDADPHNLTKSTIEELPLGCGAAHVPYAPPAAAAGAERAELQRCAGCSRARVPGVLLASCARPPRLAARGRAVPLTAAAAKIRRAPPTSEAGARDISDQLPFLEYELHKLLLAKLRMQGANAIFDLHSQIAVGERCVMALASGSAVRLCALAANNPPTIKASENDKDAIELQRALWDTFTANKIANGYDVGPEQANGAIVEAEEDLPSLDLCADKDACILELDETEDVETARLLATRRANMELFTSSLRASGAPPQAFAQVWRARFNLNQSGGASAAAERHVARALHAALYKLRRLRPCALAPPALQLDTPDDEIQLVISGTAIPLETRGAGDAEEAIFALDEETENSANNTQQPGRVVLTSLAGVPGARSARRVCALRALFVRETTAVRELGGLSGFLHTFTSEVLAIVRAYTAALGGSALSSFYITQLMLQDNAHKNQGQCLLSVGGDVVHVTY